jgi:hypothetical protein
MRSIFVSAFAAVSLLVCGTCLPAQTTPNGPYTATCQDIRMKGTTLHANCQTAEGKMTPATLPNAARCSDGVINLNGVLSCQSGTIPPGSYLSTCIDPRVQGTTLRANCKDDKGKDVSTELRNANQCVGDIANTSGALRCVASPANPANEAENKEAKKDEKKKHRLWPLKRGDKGEKPNKSS